MFIRLRALERKINLRPETVIRACTDVQARFAEQGLRKLKTYPPPKVPTTYERTGALGRGWVMNGPRQTGGGIVTTLVNNSGLRYVVFVHGDSRGEEQQEQHADTGWQLAAEAVDRDAYRKALQQAVNNALR